MHPLYALHDRRTGKKFHVYTVSPAALLARAGLRPQITGANEISGSTEISGQISTGAGLAIGGGVIVFILLATALGVAPGALIAHYGFGVTWGKSIAIGIGTMLGLSMIGAALQPAPAALALPAPAGA